MRNQDGIVPLNIESSPCLIGQCDWPELVSILERKRIERIGYCMCRNCWEGRRRPPDGLFQLYYHRTLLSGCPHQAPDLLNCFVLGISDTYKVQKNPAP